MSQVNLSSRSRWGWSLALLFALSLPFLNQAFHIDDQSFIAIADQILRDPLHPYAFDLNLDGTARPALNAFGNPPLFSYFLAGIIALFGHAEWALHLFSFPFVILLVVGIAKLAGRFGVPPLAAVLLTAFTPAVMVMQHTSMPDLPLLAVGVAAVVSLIHGCDHKDLRWLILAGLLAGVACLLKYGGVILLPIFLLYVVLQKRWIGLVAVGIPLGVLGAWHLLSLSVYGSSHLSVTYGSASRTFPNSLETLKTLFMPLFHYVGGVTIFPLSLLMVWPMRSRAGKVFFLLPLALAAGFALWVRFSLDYTVSQSLTSFVMLLCALSGMGALLIRPLWARPDRDQLFLILWCLGVFVSVPFQFFPAVRRILLLIPPLVLLFLRQSKGGKVAATVVLTLLLGLSVSLADREQAGLYRRFVREEMPKYRSSSGTTWFAGHWGFQHYMEESGFRPFDRRRDQLKPGDRVIFPMHPWPQISIGGLPDFSKASPGTWHLDKNLTVVTAASGLLPVRTLSKWANAHFYSHNHFPGKWQFLPYTFSTGLMEVFVITEVAPQTAAEGK